MRIDISGAATYIITVFAFNRAVTFWLPSTSILLLLYAFLLWMATPAVGDLVALSGPLLIVPFMAWGLGLAIRGSNVDFINILTRPANIVTITRSLLVIAGLILGIIGFSRGIQSSGLRIAAAVAICAGFLGDKADGIISRRERVHTKVAEYGPWFDAEIDALLIFFCGVIAVYMELAPAVFIIPAYARYFFGLFYAIVPIPLEFPRWYRLFSKNAAGTLQVVIACVWTIKLIFPGLTVLIQPAAYAVSALIILSFILETNFRLRSLLSKIPREFRPGLLRSFLIYYRIPFRYRRMVRFYGGLVAPGDLVFDIGAHLGNRIRVFRALGARVIAFEPQKSCKKILEAWFGDEETVTLDFSAVGETDGIAEIAVSVGNPTLSSIEDGWIANLQKDPEFRGIQWDEKSSVPMVSLETAIKKHGMPGFLKIDAEGSEAAILAGLSRAVQKTSFEFIPTQKEHALDCVKNLNRLGRYEYNFSIGESMRYVFDRWQNEAEIIDFISNYPRGSRSGDIYARSANAV